MRLVIVLLAAIVSACGGGGGGGGGEDKSSQPNNQKQTYIGIYTGLMDYEPIQAADFLLSGLSIEDIYAGNDLLLKKDTLKKSNAFSGDVYLFKDELATVFFSSNKQYASLLIDADYIGTYQINSLSSKTLTRASINGSWSGYYFYEYRGVIYQAAITTECTNEVCVHTNVSTKEQLSIDFAEEFKSNFKPAGAWFGRESNGGERVFSSAAASPDGNFLSMPMCWNSFALEGEIFFDICDLAVLTRKQ